MRSLLRSFAGGEVTPELFGRIDDVRFQTGLALALNFITLPHGPARNRPGTKHVAPTRDSGNGTARLLSFTFSASQTNIIEFGATATPGSGYFRFFTNGVPVLVADGPVPPAYISNKTFADTDINVGTNEITFGSAHGFTSGQPVRVTNDGGGNLLFLSPAPVGGAVVYFVNVVSATVVRLTPTQADGIAGTNIIDLIASAAANYRLNYAYAQGDLVEGTPAGAPGNHYCLQNPTINGAAQATPGNTTYWYLQPATGEYEIPHPYADTQLTGVRYFQSNDVVTLLHRSHSIRVLRRFGVTNWQLSVVTVNPTLPAPTNVSVAATQVGMRMLITGTVTANPVRLTGASVVPWTNGAALYGEVSWATGQFGPGAFRAVGISGRDFDLVNLDGSTLDASTFGAFNTGLFREVPLSSNESNTYKVTAVNADGYESLASAAASVTNNLFTEGAYNTISWTGVSGASKYHVYRLESGLYGFIGSTDAGVATSFKDDNVAADLSRALPQFDNSLNVAPFPEAGCYHEQRKVFARDQSLWMTRPGTEADLSYSLPIKDDDRIAFSIAATEFSQIQHVVSMGDLIALTSSTEYAIMSPDSAVLTPTSLMPRPQSFIGANSVKPVLVNNSLVYCAARGGHVRELIYQAVARGFVTGDLSLRAAHLFDNLTIVDMAYSKAPYPIVWAVSSSGKLLGLTYVPDQQVTGWHQHTFGADAVVESIAVVAEGNEDALYLIVRRTVNSVTVRHIERMSSMALGAVADSFFVDNGRTFTSVSAGLLTVGLHLQGKTVSILADGVVLPQQVVNSSGQVSLASGYSKVTVGLPIDAQLQTLPLAMQMDGFGQGQTKNVSEVWARVVNSAPFRLGPLLTSLVPSDAAAASIRGLSVAETLRTERVPVRQEGAWTQDGQVYISHTTPLPLTVVGLTIGVVTGD